MKEVDTRWIQKSCNGDFGLRSKTRLKKLKNETMVSNISQRMIARKSRSIDDQDPAFSKLNIALNSSFSIFCNYKFMILFFLFATSSCTLIADINYPAMLDGFDRIMITEIPGANCTRNPCCILTGSS